MSCPWKAEKLSGPTKLFAKGRKDMSGVMDGGNLSYAASDRQQGTTCVLGKDWLMGAKMQSSAQGGLVQSQWDSRHLGLRA